MRGIEGTQGQDTRVLADFAGEWRLDRQIAQADGARAVFWGRAVWRPKDDGLQYVETGVLTVEDHTPMQSERRYFWAADLSVYFDDGRFFHQVPARGGEAKHWCDPDQYDVSYDFGEWPDFRTIWRVKGPKKDYEMTSHYQREG